MVSKNSLEGLKTLIRTNKFKDRQLVSSHEEGKASRLVSFDKATDGTGASFALSNRLVLSV